MLDQQKSENELFDLGFDLTNDHSDTEPPTLNSLSRQSGLDSLQDYEELEGLEPLPMRRSPSSLGDPVRPSMTANSLTEVEPVTPLTLRRQNAISPEQVSLTLFS